MLHAGFNMIVREHGVALLSAVKATAFAGNGIIPHMAAETLGLYYGLGGHRASAGVVNMVLLGCPEILALAAVQDKILHSSPCCVMSCVPRKLTPSRGVTLPGTSS